MPRDLEKEIEDALKSNQIVDRNSLYQLKFFLINKEPTHQSRMWRCIRELKARRDTMEAISLELAELEDTRELYEIELTRLEQKECDAELDKKENDIRVRQVNRKKAALARNVIDLHKRLHEAKQEAAFFLDNFSELEKIQPLKQYDSVEVQEEYWNERLADEVKLKLLLGRPLDTELVKTVLSMRDSAPIKGEMINIFSQIQAKADVAKDENDKLAETAKKAEHSKWQYSQYDVDKEK